MARVLSRSVGAAARLSVFVVGAGKSGTSGLFAAVKAGLENVVGRPVTGLFEPKTAQEICDLGSRPMVTKMLLERFFKSDRAVLHRFDHTILIVRDPRDCLVSRLLWQIPGLPGFDTREKMRRAIDLIRQKEVAPASISVARLYREIGTIGERPQWADAAEKLAYQPLDLSNDERALCHTIRYEDFIDGRVETLNAYLGFPIVRHAVPPSPHDATLRSARHGAWRQWFTREDVERFVAPRQDKLNALGYGDMAFTERRDPLPSSEGSDYVLKIFRVRRPELFHVPAFNAVSSRLGQTANR